MYYGTFASQECRLGLSAFDQKTVQITMAVLILLLFKSCFKAKLLIYEHKSIHRFYNETGTIVSSIQSQTTDVKLQW